MFAVSQNLMYMHHNNYGYELVDFNDSQLTRKQRKHDQFFSIITLPFLFICENSFSYYNAVSQDYN